MSNDEFSAPEGGVPRTPSGVALAGGPPRLQVGRLVALLAGIAGFLVFALMPELPVAVDPLGEPFELNKQARLALGLFVLAAIWWVFEVVPVGITAIAIAVVQAVFNIRDARKQYNWPSSEIKFCSAGKKPVR